MGDEAERGCPGEQRRHDGVQHVVTPPAGLLVVSEEQPGRCPLELVDQGAEFGASVVALVASGWQVPAEESGSGVHLDNEPGPSAVDRVAVCGEQYLEPGGAHRGDANPVRGNAQRDDPNG
ncbi:hypothetical protein GCM10029964_065530 [Kibdelosporangium lantanae]